MDKYNSNMLKIFDTLEVGPVKVEPRKISAVYSVTANNRTDTIDLIYKYDEDVFNPELEPDLNLASMILSQVALNYGLLCKKIIFHGLYDQLDRKVLNDWLDISAREIFVNKILIHNPFLKKDFKPPTEKYSKNLLAELIFSKSKFDHANMEWSYSETDQLKHCVLSSGGKDSLLSYGLIDELGYDVHPIFVNESGRHWFTALNAHKYFRQNISNTSRVWVNSDRVFSFMLKHMPFIREDFQNVRSDEYPIRLWTVAVFSFGVLPLLKKRNIGRLVIGDEYDTTVRIRYNGITHYNALYDQSRYFDDSVSRYYLRKGWAISQFSILRPLSELLIEKILAFRYPDLLSSQVSCHAAHMEDGHVKPCGKCEKCRRIVGMLVALDVDPRICGYSESQIKNCIDEIISKSVNQEKAGISQLMFMLNKKISAAEVNSKLKHYKEHQEIMNLRFDHERSPINSIPIDLRKKLYKIFLEYAEGAKRKESHDWVDFNVLADPSLEEHYPFEPMREGGKQKKRTVKEKSDKNYLWTTLTWPEAAERLNETDLAILPVGALEQHGPHLPLDVDAFDAEYLSHKVAEACSQPKPLVLPLIPYGVSYHHDDFAGTVSVSNEALYKIVYDIGISVAKNGIKKILIINGHGDNAPTLNFAAQMINRDAKIFVAVDTGETSDVDLDSMINTTNDVHAGEIETSTTLAVRPDLVQMDKAEKSILKFSNRYLNFSSSRGIPWYSRTRRLSKSGVMGDPTKADAEKGKKMWEIMIAHLVAFVEDLKKMKPEQIHQKKY